MTTSDQEDDASGLIDTLRSLPLANDSFSEIRKRYTRVKSSHRIVAGTFGTIEAGIESVAALPLVKPSVAVVDKLAGSGLKRIKKSYPALRTMSSQDLQTVTKDYYKRSLLYRTAVKTTMAARSISSAALNMTKTYSLARLNEASLEVGRNIGDAVVVGKSAFITGVRFTMDTVTNAMNFFEFVVDRYFNTEAPVAVAVTSRKPVVIRSSHRATFSLDQEKEKYEDRDETCNERFGKMQRKISVCIKKQPKSLTTHLAQQSWSDFKMLTAYLLCTLWSCLQVLNYPFIRTAELVCPALIAVFIFPFTLAWSICEQAILRTIKLWTLVLAVTSRQVKKTSCALPSQIRTPVQSTADYFENLHESLADTRNLFDVKVELTAEREEIRKMASAAISKVRRWTKNG